MCGRVAGNRPTQALRVVHNSHPIRGENLPEFMNAQHRNFLLIPNGTAITVVDFLAVSRCMMTCACFEESVIACNVICLDVRSKQNAIELKSNPTQANMNWRMQGQSKNHVSHVKLNHSLPGRRCCMTSNRRTAQGAARTAQKNDWISFRRNCSCAGTCARTTAAGGARRCTLQR